MYQILLVFTIIVGAFMQIESSVMQEQTCTNDSECKYGRCDQDRGSCVCGLTCSEYPEMWACNNISCVNAKTPCRAALLCRELEEQCTHTRIRGIILTVSGTDCRAAAFADSSETEVFCHDQSYCSQNGICLMKNGTPKCKCKSGFTGRRCRNHMRAVSVQQNAKTEKTFGKLLVSPSLVFVLSAAIPCMLFVIVIRNRRQSRFSSSSDCAAAAEEMISSSEKKKMRDVSHHKTSALGKKQLRNSKVDNRTDCLGQVCCSNVAIKDGEDQDLVVSSTTVDSESNSFRNSRRVAISVV